MGNCIGMILTKITMQDWYAIGTFEAMIVGFFIGLILSAKIGKKSELNKVFSKPDTRSSLYGLICSIIAVQCIALS